MDQSRALNALAPFTALAKSATSPRAAADLITQATSAPNTYVFAELLQQPNIQALSGHEQYGASYELLKVFAWGTWESFKTANCLPQLSDAQSTKLRLLSLLTIAAQQPSASSTASHLSYTSLCTRLDLTSTVDLEHLITQAIYSDLLNATLNPASQTVAITSVAPLRDLAPGSINNMLAELSAWSSRCDSVLADLEAEIVKVKAKAKKRHAREQKAEKQIKAVTDAADRGTVGVLSESRSGRNTRGASKKMEEAVDEFADAMDVDGSSTTGTLGGGGGIKRGGGPGAVGGIIGKLSGGRVGK